MFPPKERRKLIESTNTKISLKRQSELLGISRSSLYYVSQVDPRILKEKQILLNTVDEIYTAHPFYGKRRISAELKRRGFDVGVKRARSLMDDLGIEAIYPRPKTSKANPEHRVYPYLLRNVVINRKNHVWSTDITYIRLQSGWIYLVAIIDWFSRFVLAWDISITLEKDFCVETLEKALNQHPKPDIFNSDQGCQFTSLEFTDVLKKNEIDISMDGRGRFLDNIFVERLWRTVKYEEVYLKNYSSVPDAIANLRNYFDFYNNQRPHQAHNYKTPAEIYLQKTIT